VINKTPIQTGDVVLGVLVLSIEPDRVKLMAKDAVFFLMLAQG